MEKKVYQSPVTDIFFTGAAENVLLASGVGFDDDDMGRFTGDY